MLIQTTGVVLTHIPYKETSIIVSIFTKDLGRIALIENNVRTSSQKNAKMAAFQPLSQLDMVVYYNEVRDIHRLKEYKIRYAYNSLHTEYRKILLCQFIVECLSKFLQEGEVNYNLFHYLTNQLLEIDCAPDISQAPIELVCQLILNHGVMYSSAEDFFNQLLVYKNYKVSQEVINELSPWLNFMRGISSETSSINPNRRPILLDMLLLYLSISIESFSVLKSLEIIRSIYI